MDVRLTILSAAARIAQGRIYGQILGECLARPKCTAFVTWGFTDLYSWLGAEAEALPFDRSFRHKPAFDSLALRLAKPK